MTGRPHPLELESHEFRALVEAAAERIAAHIAALGEQPSADTSGGADLARELRQAEPPERPTAVSELLDLLFDRVAPKTYNAAGPGYLAYIPGGGLVQSAVADLVAGSLNRYTGLFAAAPGLVQLEANVITWLCGIIGLGGGSGGILTSGGSLANWTAIVTARCEILGEDFGDGTIYLSDQTHHSIPKGALLAGFPRTRLRIIPSGEDYRMPLDLLERAIAQDREAGLRPAMIVGNAGTIGTGAVDPLPEMAALARREGLWFHVDAAYGGFFRLTERGGRILRGLERADSVVLDPHKGLFVPYGTGALLVRDREALRRTHSYHAAYLPPIQVDPDLPPDFAEISPELSRPFRGLRLWLPIQMHGIAAFRSCLDEKLDLARWAAEALREIPDIEILAEPVLSTVAFRLDPGGLDDEALNELNRAWQASVNARQRVHLTTTMLDGRLALRICVLSFRTHLDRMQMAIEDLAAAAVELGSAATR